MYKICKCTAAGRAHVNFMTFLLGGRFGDGSGSFSTLDRLLRATTKKVVNFFEEKSAPQTKSWLRLCSAMPWKTIVALFLSKVFELHKPSISNSCIT